MPEVCWGLDHGARLHAPRCVWWWPGKHGLRDEGRPISYRAPPRRRRRSRPPGALTHSTKVCREPRGRTTTRAPVPDGGQPTTAARTTAGVSDGGCRRSGARWSPEHPRARGIPMSNLPRSRAASTAAPARILPPYLLDRLRQAPEPSGRVGRRAHARGRRPGAGHREVRAARRGGDRSGPPPPAASSPQPLLQKAHAHDRHAAGCGRCRPRCARSTTPHGTTLPGRWSVARAPTPSDDPVNRAYDGLGATWQLYWSAFQRDSLDAKGLELIASVHYQQSTTTRSGTASRWCSATGTAPTSTTSPRASTSSGTS